MGACHSSKRRKRFDRNHIHGDNEENNVVEERTCDEIDIYEEYLPDERNAIEDNEENNVVDERTCDEIDMYEEYLPDERNAIEDIIDAQTDRAPIRLPRVPHMNMYDVPRDPHMNMYDETRFLPDIYPSGTGADCVNATQENGEFCKEDTDQFSQVPIDNANRSLPPLPRFGMKRFHMNHNGDIVDVENRDAVLPSASHMNLYDETNSIPDTYPSGTDADSVYATQDNEENNVVDERTCDEIEMCEEHLPDERNAIEIQSNESGQESAISQDSAFSDRSGGSYSNISNGINPSKIASVRNTENNTNNAKKTQSKYTAWKENFADPAEHIPRMVDIFRIQLERSIKVREVISYLPFIDERDTAEILSLERESPCSATSRLLDRIVESTDLGKWPSFLTALRTVGYQYIGNLLTGKTEADFTIHKALVKIFEPQIINRMDTARFRDHLYEEDAISVMDKEEIECEERNRGQIAANMMMIDRVHRKLENWYQVLIDTMKKCGMGDIVDNFEYPELSIQNHVVTSIYPTGCNNLANRAGDPIEGLQYLHPSTDDGNHPAIPIHVPAQIEDPPSPPPPVPPRIPYIISTLEAEKAILLQKVVEKKKEKQLRESLLLLQHEYGKLTKDTRRLRVNYEEHTLMIKDEETKECVVDEDDCSDDTTPVKQIVNVSEDIVEDNCKVPTGCVVDGDEYDDDTMSVKQIANVSEDIFEDTDAPGITVLNEVPTQKESRMRDDSKVVDTKNKTTHDSNDTFGVNDKTDMLAVTDFNQTMDVMKQEIIGHISKEIEKTFHSRLMNMEKCPGSPSYLGTHVGMYPNFGNPNPHPKKCRLDSGMGTGNYTY